MTVVRPPRLGLFAAAPDDPVLVAPLLAGLAERGWVIADIAEGPALQFLLSPAFDTEAFLAVFADVLDNVRSGRFSIAETAHTYGQD